MHYIIYQITNRLNGMIYIGQHRTEDLNDGYMGSGIYLNQDIQLYGKENFTKKILFECSSIEELNQKERELVNEEFVNRDDTYNLAIGGSYILTNFQAKKFGRAGALVLKHRIETDPEFRKEFYHKAGIGSRRVWKEHPEVYKDFRCDWTGRHHTDETKKQISEKAKLRVGSKNSIFNRIWMYNELVKCNTTIDKKDLHDYLEQGWKVGRIMNWDRYFMKKNQYEARLQKKKELGFNAKTPDKFIDEFDNNRNYYKKLLPLFLKYRWKDFVKLSGYKYSNQNFYFQVKVYLGLTRPELKKMKMSARTLHETSFDV